MLSLARALAALSLAVSIGPAEAYTQDCRNLPGDAGWPNLAAWSKLDATLKGQLIATVPQAHVCHRAPYHNYDPTVCTKRQPIWTQAETCVRTPAEIMNAYFQNQSCDPFTSINRTCEVGNYAAYSINVTTAQHVIAGFEFARQHNIRLVVKTCGHAVRDHYIGSYVLFLVLQVSTSFLSLIPTRD